MSRVGLADLFTGILGVCALVSATLAVKQYSDNRLREEPIAAPSFVAEWRAIEGLAGGEGRATTGGRQAPVVVEFSDIQCPFCAIAHARLRELQASAPASFRLMYRHRPLASHPYAITGAVAAECTRAEGRFDAFLDVAFAHQSEIGRTEWTALARLAGVRDLAAFSTCLAREEPLARVLADNEVAKRIGVVGTPGILIRDSLWLGALSLSDLHARIERASR